MLSEFSNCSVDTHFHIFNAGEGIPNARYRPAYDAPLHAWMAKAGAVGVTHGVLVQTSFMGTDNRLLTQTLRAHPERLRGVAVVAPDVSMEALHGLHRDGVRGLRLNLSGQDHQVPQWAGATALWDAVGELGWHLELHTDPGGLPQVVAQLPSTLPLVVDHMGKPLKAEPQDATVLALVRRAALAPVHVKLSGAYRLAGVDATPLARLWVQELGADHLLWGSDWPCTNHEHEADYAALFQALVEWVGPGHLHQILAVNPQRLYWGFVSR
jgi:predicted TIM-barrel fold metal-dependent hydrolase